MENPKAKKGDKTKLSADQVNDLTSSLRAALETLEYVKKEMDINGMSHVHPTNYKSGTDAWADFVRLVSAILNAYTFEMAIRRDAIAFTQHVAESKPPDYVAESPKPVRKTRPKK